MWLSDSEADWQPRANIDLTPMIGVLAALLAIFALSIQQNRDLPFSLPQVDLPPNYWLGRPPPRDFDVRVAPDGALTVEGLHMSASEFDAFVALAKADTRPPIFHLRMASHTRYQTMASLLDTLQHHDVEYFDFEDDAR